MLAAIIAIIPLALAIFSEIFSAQARARAANEKFVLDQATFKAAVESALSKQLASMAKTSQGQSSGWDSADQDAAKTKNDGEGL